MARTLVVLVVHRVEIPVSCEEHAQRESLSLSVEDEDGARTLGVPDNDGWNERLNAKKHAHTNITFSLSPYCCLSLLRIKNAGTIKGACIF